MKLTRFFSMLLAVGLLLSPCAAAEDALRLPPVTYHPAAEDADPIPDTTAKAALLMDKTTGTVLWSREADKELAPASVTKVMTMLLVCEALDEGTLSQDQTVTVSAHASQMGGSQIYLKEGEEMTVSDLLKAVAVVSGNDAAVALGEAVAGTESAFVEQMNRRAQELGMEHTHFANCTGLPAPEHRTTARDIAVMSRELLSHDRIRPYTAIWMDSLRDGAFTLSSTNKLLKQMEGCTGLKTGCTGEAGYCISASAQREDRELIAVILGADSSKDRFAAAKGLLEWGFASFRTVSLTPEGPLAPIPVTLGKKERVRITVPTVEVLVRAGEETNISSRTELLPSLTAPVTQETQVGAFVVSVGDQVAAAVPLFSADNSEKQTFSGMFTTFIKFLFSGDW